MLRLDGVKAVGVHVIQHTADELRHQVGLQRPRRVGVADRERHVRHVRQHHALVGHGVVHVDRQAIARDRRAAEQLHVQTRCGDDDVGLQLLTGGQLDAGLGEALDRVGDDVGLALA